MSENKLTGYPSIDKPWLKYYNSTFIAKPIPKMNIYSYLQAKTADYQDYTAISYWGVEITYRELFEHIDSVAKLLVKIGVRENDRIMYLMPNIPETAYFFYASARLGAVADFIDPRPDSLDSAVSAQKVLAMIRDEKVKHIVALDQCYLAMIVPIEEELLKCGVCTTVLVSADDSMTIKAKLNYLNEKSMTGGISSTVTGLKANKKIANLLKEAQAKSALNLVKYRELINQCEQCALPDISYRPEQLVAIVHTSGTTSSKPKPIPLTHDNFNFYAHQTFGANMPMQIGDRQLHILPYFAAFGIVDVLHACLCHINNLIQIPEFSPSALGVLIKIYKPQTIIGTPSWFLGLLQDKHLRKADLSFLTMVTYGGDSMEVADEEQINKFLSIHGAQCKLTKGHGMSETCGCASYAIEPYDTLASIGIPMPLTTYAIVDPDSKDLLKFEEGQEYLEGEIIISSGAVTPGVLDGQVIVPHREYNGDSYIFTRDIVRMDRNGVMSFLARSDRSFTRFDGFKIKPYEIENIIKAYSGIVHCVLTPIYDTERFGNLAVANIVTSVPIETHEERIAFVRKLINTCFIHNPNVSTRQIPAYIIFYNSFPLTKNGKTDINAITRNAAEQEKICVSFSETNISVSDLIIQ